MFNNANNTLAKLQALMGAAIMRPLDNDNMQKTWVDGSNTSDYAATFIKPNKKLTSHQRLEIYNKQYWYRLLESLQDDFPGLNALLGHIRFENLAIAYLSRYPSRSYALNNLGMMLANFIKEKPEYTTPDHEAAYDLACLEWAEIKAFDAKANQPLQAISLQKTAPEKLILFVQPYLSILELKYAVDSFLLALSKEHNKSVESNAVTNRTIRFKQAVRPKKQRTYLVVHRLNNTVYYKRLDRSQYILLNSLMSQKTLSEACQELMSTNENTKLHPKLVAKINKSFTDWMELGWFCQPDSSCRL